MITRALVIPAICRVSTLGICDLWFTVNYLILNVDKYEK